MAIVPYKQSLTHSCLAACFLMLLERQFTESDEQQLAINGSKRVYPFYVVGIPLEFVKKYNNKIVVYVDNKFFTSVLQKSFSQDKRISVMHKKITISLIQELLSERPVICHIDDHALGDFSHASHFIVLERVTNKFINIVDPWTGTRRKISIVKLEESIADLKNRIKMCPLLFSIVE